VIKVAIIASTGGSVMNAALQQPYIQERIHTVISDRECRAIRIAEEYGIETRKFITKDAQEFSEDLDQFFSRNPHDLIISFYTKIFHGDILDRFRGRFVNFHPSILPACPGMDGFEDTIKSGSRFVGATVHLVDRGVDTGFPIIQSALPYDPLLSFAKNRHAVFIAQCKMLLQTVRWYEEGRIIMDELGRPNLTGGKYEVSEFAPNLDFLLAVQFIP
jgi:phosphoribosylglycinamide formyltransferase 1